MIVTTILAILTIVCFIGILYDKYYTKYKVYMYVRWVNKKALNTPIDFSKEPNINKYIRQFTSVIKDKVSKIASNTRYYKYVPYKIEIEYGYYSINAVIYSRCGEKEDTDTVYLLSHSNKDNDKSDVLTSSKEFPIMLQALHKLDLKFIIFEAL